jgi:flagellar motor switch protein FliM
MASSTSGVAASEVLSQSEVEAILASIQSGHDPSAKVISRQSGGFDEGKHNVQPFDFRSPVFLTPSQMRRLRIKHEEFIRNLSSTLSVFLRSDFNMQMSRLETTTYKSLIDSMTMPSYLTLFRMKPLNGIAILDISPRLGLTVIDRMLGGPGHSVKVEREFTDMETTVLQNFIKVVIKEYLDSWLRFQKLEWEGVANENTMRFLNLEEQDETMLYLEIEARFGDCVAPLRFIFSYRTIESLVEQLMKEIADDTAEQDIFALPENRQAPSYNIRVPISSYWRGFTVTLGDLRNIVPGDVLMLDQKKCEEVDVFLGNIPKYKAKMDRSGKGVEITLTSKIVD